ncbi:hypothetical protein [Desulfolithobacter sp.]
MLSWNGEVLPDFPALRVFDLETDPSSLLYTAMDLERGAQRFYTMVLEKYPDQSFSGAIDLLARAEEGHARLVYDYWSGYQEGSVPPFSALYEDLPGDILESGQDVEELVARFDRIRGPVCVNVVEMALSIEMTAYDLYRNMAHRYSGTEMETPFLALAQAEKEHMRIAADALLGCASR